MGQLLTFNPVSNWKMVRLVYSTVVLQQNQMTWTNVHIYFKFAASCNFSCTKSMFLMHLQYNGKEGLFNTKIKLGCSTFFKIAILKCQHTLQTINSLCQKACDPARQTNARVITSKTNTLFLRFASPVMSSCKFCIKAIGKTVHNIHIQCFHHWWVFSEADRSVTTVLGSEPTCEGH